MNRNSISLVLVVAAAVLVGWVLGLSPAGKVARAEPMSDDAAATAVDVQTETVNQLKEIQSQLKDLNVLLCSGKVRVVVVINPDHP